jgi:hypothetical protein
MHQKVTLSISYSLTHMLYLPSARYMHWMGPFKARTGLVLMASLSLVFDLLSCCVSLTMHSGLRLPEPDPSLAFPSVAGLRVWSWARPFQYGRRDFTVVDLRRGWDIIRSEDTMDTSFKYIDWGKKGILNKRVSPSVWVCHPVDWGLSCARPRSVSPDGNGEDRCWVCLWRTRQQQTSWTALTRTGPGSLRS